MTQCDVGMTQTPLPPAYAELVARARWVCWRHEGGKKVPYAAARPSRPADALNPSNWASFDDAMAAATQHGFDGVGFALNGDGIVGIDLDDCVDEGCIEPQAMELMRTLGCGLVEISPSGNGLRGFGRGPNLPRGVREQYKGIRVELYSDRRYLTVTGKTVVGNGVASLTGFDQLALELQGGLTEATEATEATEETEATDSSGGGDPNTANTIEFPPICIPRRQGERNLCLFHLARVLKARYPNAEADSLQAVVRQWHRHARPHMRTQDFEVSWVEFKVAHKRVAQPYGLTLEKILADLPEVPDSLMKASYGEKTIHLIRICLALQREAGDAPFFLGCRKAGELIGVSHTVAASFLQLLVDDNFLSAVSKGSGRKSTRYRARQF